MRLSKIGVLEGVFFTTEEAVTDFTTVSFSCEKYIGFTVIGAREPHETRKRESINPHTIITADLLRSILINVCSLTIAYHSDYTLGAGV